MTTTFLFDEFASEIRERATAMNGQNVTVNLVGGQVLAGTLTYVLGAIDYPPGATRYPAALTVTVAGKVHTARLDHVSSIGQG
ncbi:hypothetical protein ACJ6WF_06175 [Streptomyces sp. MMS24-I2-30]|uniref:hypothetical protein n=1 Tax=Streptomyces sp. MMS24-I2-30 TaxID=3351564 RepID=UPI003896C93A